MNVASNIGRFDGAYSQTRLSAVATTLENSNLKSSPQKKVAIIIPCRNEDEVLPETIRRISALVDRLVAAGKFSHESKIVFVDDGSTDRTWELIRDAAEKSSYIGGLKLTRNYGHQNALLAALFTVEGDALISIDADLQDDESAIEAMVAIRRRERSKLAGNGAKTRRPGSGSPLAMTGCDGSIWPIRPTHRRSN